jgi:hypothetical protein
VGVRARVGKFSATLDGQGLVKHDHYWMPSVSANVGADATPSRPTSLLRNVKVDDVFLHVVKDCAWGSCAKCQRHMRNRIEPSAALTAWRLLNNVKVPPAFPRSTRGHAREGSPARSAPAGNHLLADAEQRRSVREKVGAKCHSTSGNAKCRRLLAASD